MEEIFWSPLDPLGILLVGSGRGRERKKGHIQVGFQLGWNVAFFKALFFSLISG
jgi:hypothetical protein